MGTVPVRYYPHIIPKSERTSPARVPYSCIGILLSLLLQLYGEGSAVVIEPCMHSTNAPAEPEPLQPSDTTMVGGWAAVGSMAAIA